jgi:PAS domain S-box-containing protein
VLEKFLDVGSDLLAVTSRDGYFHWISPAWTRTLGWTGEELMSRPWLEFVHPDDRETSKKEEAVLLEGGESIRFENRYQTKAGDYRWLSWRIKPASGDGLFYSGASDITERKKAEMALEEALELHQLLVESAQDFAIQVTDPEGWIQQWNPGAERIFGYSKEEAVGQKADLIFTPEDRAAKMPARELETAISQGCAADDRWHLRKDGQRVFISGMVRPLYSREKKLRGLLKIGRDITKRKQMEEELKEARENLERLVETRTANLQETVQGMEQFTYSLVHDLRAPLRSMCSFAQLIQAEYAEKLDDEGKGYLTRIERSAGRMDALIRDVLSYSRTGQISPELEEVDLESLLKQLVSENRAFQPPTAMIVWEKPMLRVKAHMALLTQVISNLLSNAVKFVPKGEVPKIRIWTEPMGSEVRIWCEDSGIGIEAQYLGKIFGMFERLHSESEYPGTGIGLAIVRKAVDRMGGTIGVESEAGKGSRFWIQFKAGSEGP